MKRPIHQATSEDIALMTYGNDPQTCERFPNLTSQAELDSDTTVFMPRPDACSDDLWLNYHEQDEPTHWAIWGPVVVLAVSLIGSVALTISGLY